MRLLAVPRATRSQARHDLDQVVPRVVRRLRRQRHQRHRDRGRQRGARHAGNDLGRDAARSSDAQQRRQTRENRRAGCRARRAPRSRRSRASRSAFDEAVDLVACRRARKAPRRRPTRATSSDAVLAKVAAQVGRREQRNGAADGAQRLEASDRQQAGIARAEPDDAHQHGCAASRGSEKGPGMSRGPYRACRAAIPRYLVGAAAGGCRRQSPASAAGDGKRSAKRGSMTTIFAFCCRPCRNG